MSYTAIVAWLQEQHEAADLALAEKAQAEYGDAFKQKFAYRRGSEKLVMVKPADIARRYRKINGLPSFE